MPVKLTLREKTHEVREGMTLRDALLKLDIPPQSVLTIREGELLTDEQILKDGDEIRLISVISGG
jgi:sulfur carrier protein